MKRTRTRDADANGLTPYSWSGFLVGFCPARTGEAPPVAVRRGRPDPDALYGWPALGFLIVPAYSAASLAIVCQIWHTVRLVTTSDKTLVVLSGEIKTPPLSKQARIEAGVLLRRLQRGETLSRIVYRTDPREILVVEVFSKKTQQTPRQIIDTCIRRLREWDAG
jgi:hypothetical protein